MSLTAVYACFPYNDVTGWAACLAGVYANDAGLRPSGAVSNRPDRLLPVADVGEEKLPPRHLSQLAARLQRLPDDVHHTEGGPLSETVPCVG